MAITPGMPSATTRFRSACSAAGGASVAGAAGAAVAATEPPARTRPTIGAARIREMITPATLESTA